jgi:hypothetical protein
MLQSLIEGLRVKVFSSNLQKPISTAASSFETEYILTFYTPS